VCEWWEADLNMEELRCRPVIIYIKASIWMQTYLGARNGIIVNKLETIVAQTALGRGSGGTPS
jgi:hypothetical protein